MFFQMANSLSSSFSSLIQIVPAAINAATCAGRLMAVSELEKEISTGTGISDRDVPVVLCVCKSAVSVAAFVQLSDRLASELSA